MTTVDSFGSQGVLDVQGAEYEIFRLKAVEGSQKLPYSLKVLLENLLRTCLLYTSPSPRDVEESRMPSSA